MINLTRLNGTQICINAFLIEHLEQTPDTVVTLTNGHRFVVSETMDDVIKAAVEYMGRLREEGVNPITVAQLGRIQ